MTKVFLQPARKCHLEIVKPRTMSDLQKRWKSACGVGFGKDAFLGVLMTQIWAHLVGSTSMTVDGYMRQWPPRNARLEAFTGSISSVAKNGMFDKLASQSQSSL